MLTYHRSNWALWNPVEGTDYSTLDTFCPLRHVSCVFNADNIWANVSEMDAPACLVFNFDNPKSKSMFALHAGHIRISQLVFFFSFPPSSDSLAPVLRASVSEASLGHRTSSRPAVL